MFGSVLKKFLGSKHEREVKKIQPIVDAINGLEPKIKKMSDEKLRARTGQFREKLENGAPVDDLLIPAFATVREAAIRTLGMRHYDVQLIGGTVLHQGKIAEMKTGEGKTLVSTLPCYLNGLTGKGVHVVTVNDYLAGRDAEWMGQVHAFLGLEVGVIHPGQGNAAKKRAYQAAITYGQNNEFGFDYLRDNMKFSIYDYAQKPLHYAIIDEVDSILIDEARTPLIISGPGETASEKYTKICAIIPRFRKEEHYEVDEKARSTTLTEEGNGYAQQLLDGADLLEHVGSTLVQEGAYRTAADGGANLYDPVNLETLHILQQSLRAHTLYKRDQHYMVKDDQILIIDEFTGRTLPGRRWSDGLHQAVEAKERVPIKDENITLATISFQNLFRLYDKLAGMTGTADTEASEFHDIYKLDTVVIPTNKPIDRADCEDLVYKTEREKFRAVAVEIEEANGRGQPVLVGTTSVEKSDALSGALKRQGIDHNVLNAKQHEREAYIVAQAGQRGAVTVATNMAGRGTDIVLGGNAEMLAKLDVMAGASDELKADPKALGKAIEEAQAQYAAKYAGESEAIKEAGGLRVIGTERHESRRIDNQLRGRSGRQGDPGHSRFYLSLEDDLMRIFAGDRIQAMMDRLGMEEDIPIEHRWVSKAVENAQKKVEERNFDIRKHLLKYDDVMNEQRKSVYVLRRQVLTGQYRTVLTDDERKKGMLPEPMVTEVIEELRDRAEPIILKLIQVHSYPIPEGGIAPEDMEKVRDMALEVPLEKLKGTRWLPLERDLYVWFGCQLDLKKLAQGSDSAALYKFCSDEVAMSLTEQRERLLDMIDELLGMMIEKACPPDQLAEDWEIAPLIAAYEEQFGIQATGLDGIAEPEVLAAKMYKDAEAVVLRKEKEFGPENFLRLFRNFYLRDIDRRWIEHLQSMDHLRDGIGLRGYGQKKPEQEYKREGYDMYVQMLQGITSSVTRQIISVTQAREEDLQRLEEQRRKEAEKRQERMSGSHKSMSVGVDDDAAAVRAERARKRRGGRGMPAPRGAAAFEGDAPPRQETVRRDAPKVGRNDPCPCGSGKKYKKCCGRANPRGDGAAAR